MQWTIPGTVLTATTEEIGSLEDRFKAMFLGGGMMLSQVAAVTGLEPYTIQNWVKRGFLAKPTAKKYTLRQLCRIININMLKDALPMEEICGLLSYVNGDLDDEGDDLIDDSQLYFLFIHMAARHKEMQNPEERDACVAQVMAEYVEPVPGARQRVEKVLKVMLTAWAAAALRQRAMAMTNALKNADIS